MISVVEVVNAVKHEWTNFVLAPVQPGESIFIVGHSALAPIMTIESTSYDIPDVTWGIACFKLACTGI
jgi:hypothetical protein